MDLILDGNNLTLDNIYNVACHLQKVKLHEAAQKKVSLCREYVEKIIAENRLVYGLTTGFGKFSTIRIKPDQIEQLQENLILSHATAVGPYLSQAETRAIMLLRINVLAQGHSGIRLSTLQALIDLLNAEVHPCIPEKGSVGASGDLAQLSHLALVLLGKGKAEYQGKIVTGQEALEKAGIEPVKLQAKEGLALNNGTQVMTAITALSLMEAEKLAKTADITAAMSIDALLGTRAAFDPLIHKLRPYQGQKDSAANIYKLMENSELNLSHLDCPNVQDAYSIRCSPQVHGAVRETLTYVKNIVEVEINAVTDNPLIFPAEDKVISGGNFHGEPVALAADSLGMAVAELANIAERRMEQMLNPALNRGLKPFLATQPGLDSGYMIAQLTAASLVSENKILAHPASVDSIPTSANQEDHVSMGTIAAVKARNIINNVSYVLAIELLVACQALDDRDYMSSPVIEQIKQEIRKDIPTITHDRVLHTDIEKTKNFILSHRILEITQQFIKIH